MLTGDHKKVLRDIAPKDGFAFFAGFDGDEVNLHFVHATIYAADDKFYVVGVVGNGEPICVECDTVEGAAEEWKKLFGGRDTLFMEQLVRHKQERNKNP